jgi:hypothetical protein
VGGRGGVQRKGGSCDLILCPSVEGGLRAARNAIDIFSHRTTIFMLNGLPDLVMELLLANRLRDLLQRSRNVCTSPWKETRRHCHIMVSIVGVAQCASHVLSVTRAYSGLKEQVMCACSLTRRYNA